MGRFKTSARGGVKYVYTALKNKGRIYAWKEHNLKTDTVKRVDWSKVKKVFSSEYDKEFAKRIARRRHITQNSALKIIKDYRLHGKDFGELY